MIQLQGTSAKAKEMPQVLYKPAAYEVKMSGFAYTQPDLRAAGSGGVKKRTDTMCAGSIEKCFVNRCSLLDSCFSINIVAD